MGEANVIPRRCTLARLMLSFRLSISILSLGLIMTSFSGCVLPIGPRFEDPPTTENLPPFIKSTTPPQGSIVTAVNRTQMFSVTFTDANADALHVRWLGEYPPFSVANTHTLQSDKDIAAPVNGQPVDNSQPINVSCTVTPLALTSHRQRVAPGSGAHGAPSGEVRTSRTDHPSASASRSRSSTS